MHNILLVSAVFPPEPVVSSRLSKDLADLLSQFTHVTVLSPSPSRPSGFDFDNRFVSDESFNHVILKSYVCPKSTLFGRMRESYSFGKATKEYIQKNGNQISAVYVNTWPLLAQYLTLKAAKEKGIPTVLHVQDIYPEALVSKLGILSRLVIFLLLPLDSWMLRNSARVVAISNKMKEYLSSTRGVKLSSIEVVSNWQDENAFIPPHFDKMCNDDNRPLTFMFLGNIGPVAGCDLLIDAFVSLNSDQCKLVIAGSGSMKNVLMEKAKKLNIKSIEFLSVPDGDVPQTQAMADVLLLPIKKGAASSSIPSKLPAYMFSAKPIIASVDCESDTAEAIIKASCGWVVEPENTSALKDVMQKTLDMSKEELTNMGVKGRDYALKHFSKKNNLRKLVGIIEELIDI